MKSYQIIALSLVILNFATSACVPKSEETFTLKTGKQESSIDQIPGDVDENPPTGEFPDIIFHNGNILIMVIFSQWKTANLMRKPSQ